MNVESCWRAQSSIRYVFSNASVVGPIFFTSLDDNQMPIGGLNVIGVAFGLYLNSILEPVNPRCWHSLRRMAPQLDLAAKFHTLRIWRHLELLSNKCSFDCCVGRRSHSFCRPGITPTSVESKKLFNVYSVELQSQSFHIEWLHRGCFTDFHFVHFFVEF